MPFLYLAAIDTAVVLTAVLLPGLAATALIQSIRPRFADDPPSALLTSAAIGLLLNTLIFLIGYKLRIDFTQPVSFAIIQAINFGVIVICLTRADAPARFKKLLSELVSDKIFLTTLAAGFALGCLALIRFPHSFDSGQLHWTQLVLTGAHADPWPMPMFGYSALIALPAAWTAALPLVTSAAGFKPFLLSLAMLVAWQATYALDLRPRLMAVAVFMIAMIFSIFGAYGLLTLGKDSLFGILFMVSMLLSFSREDAETRGIEIGLFLAAASVMGIIAVPYALVAYGLWFLFASPRSWPTMIPVLAINSLTLPVVVATFARAPSLLIYAAYLAGAAGCILVISVLRRFLPARQFKMPAIAITLIIWFAAAAGYFLMPVRVAMDVALKLDGTPDTRIVAPTDGLTTFFQMLTVYPLQTVSTLAGLFAILTIGFTGLGRSRPGLVAAGATVFVSTALVLAHQNAGLKLLSPFNTWDLLKDVPMWLGGSLIALFSVVLAATVGRRLFGNLGSIALLATLGIAIVLYAYPRANVPHYLRMPYYAKYTASEFQPVALAASEVWSSLRGKRLYLYKESLLAGDQYFFTWQMYGATPFIIDASFKGVSLDDVSGFIIAPIMAPTLITMARSIGASVRHVSVSSDDAEMFIVSRDGKSTVDVPSSGIADQRGVADIASGAHGLEIHDGARFSWVNRSLELSVTTSANDAACVQVSLFSTGLPNTDGIINILLEGQHIADVSLKGATFGNPATASIRLPPGKERIALTLRGLFEPILFKSDPRQVSFGVRRPILVLPQESCR